MSIPKLIELEEGVSTERKSKKPKILLLSDDMTAPSGIGIMSREMVVNSVDVFDWVQLGATRHHPNHGEVNDISNDIAQMSEVPNANVKVYQYSGYGNPNVMRELLEVEQPDAIMHFTDPRFWTWLYRMEHEIHTKYNIPILYYAIWDNFPIPYWNYAAYKSCDAIAGISKQSHFIHRKVLEFFGTDTVDFDKDDISDVSLDGSNVMLRYIPHGNNSDIFVPMTEEFVDDEELAEYNQQKDNFFDTEYDFVVFWINRNVRRKQPGDVILAFKKFCDMLPDDKSDKCVMVMHTDVKDKNGTDLVAVKRAVAPDCNIIFSTKKIPDRAICYYYNMADVSMNISSNEGFGLSVNQALLSGTPSIINVTGGLQDQARFEVDGEWFEPTDELPSNHNGYTEECGEWIIPVFPSNISLQGSIPTPYIFDDRADSRDVAAALMEVYEMSPEERNKRGMSGRKWVTSDEASMYSEAMGYKLKEFIEESLERYETRPRYTMSKVELPKEIDYNGISI